MRKETGEARLTCARKNGRYRGSVTTDDEPTRELHPDLAAALAETRAALEGLTGEARRMRAAGLRFRGAGHAIGAVPDLPPDEA